MIVNGLINWVVRHRAAIAKAGYQIEIRIPSQEVDNQSASVDLESEFLLARITVWENGLCDLELLNVDSSKPSVFEHLQLKPDDNLDERLAPFLLRLSGEV